MANELIAATAMFGCTVRERNLTMDYTVARRVTVRRVEGESREMAAKRLRAEAKKLDGIAGYGCIMNRFTGVLKMLASEKASDVAKKKNGN
jgi:hypothetical protein